MKIKILIILLTLIINSTIIFGNSLTTSSLTDESDVGVGEPSNIRNGDNLVYGPQNLMVTATNNGETPASIEIDFSLDALEGLDWKEINSINNGPYDLDPDVWVESFFDIGDFLTESLGNYRATFSLDTPLDDGWKDDNPKNDKYEAIFTVKNTSKIKEWYVDPKADPGGDGSKEKPFNKISDAVEKANIGDIINVAEGTYNENLVIDKDYITISTKIYNVSQNPSNFIIDGNNDGSVITIIGEGVTISGLNIKNSGDYEEDAAIDVFSDNNNIGWNIIEENKASGIYLHDSANSNYIHHNIIQNNDGAGIFIWQDSKNNYIYHNDFINNGWYNVKDKEGGNYWNHSLPFGGNYWDDFDGSDLNEDGIIDSSYKIMGDYDSTGIDEYPWIEPHKWNNHLGKPEILGLQNGTVGTEYEYDFYVEHENFGPGSDPFTEPAVCHVDWGDGSEEWHGFNHIPNYGKLHLTLSHKWDEEGSYIIQVQFIDSYEYESEWTSLELSMPKSKSLIPFGLIFVYGFDVDVKIIQLEPGEDYVDLEILSKPLYILENGIQTRNPGEFIRLYNARGLFSPSLPLCFGICDDWGIIG